MKKTLVVILAAVLIISLAGCGSGTGAVSDNGVYTARTAYINGVAAGIDEVFAGGFTIELRDGGRAILNLDGEEYNLKWECEETLLHIIAADTEFYGQLSRGLMLFRNFQESGADIVLICDEIFYAGLDTEKASAYSDYWGGRWYGWWIYNTGWGDYEGYEGLAWDVLADITVSGNEGILKIWDLDEDENHPTTLVRVKFTDGVTENGKMLLEDGVAYGSFVKGLDWQVDPGDSTVKSLEHMIEIVGMYSDPENPDNGYEFRIYMRPWGMDWEDVAVAESDDFIYDDMLPAQYDDWYLEQIG